VIGIGSFDVSIIPDNNSTNDDSCLPEPMGRTCSVAAGHEKGNR